MQNFNERGVVITSTTYQYSQFSSFLVKAGLHFLGPLKSAVVTSTLAKDTRAEVTHATFGENHSAPLCTVPLLRHHDWTPSTW